MTDQDQALPLLDFFGREAASPHGLNAEEWKQVARDAGANYLFGFVGSRQRHGHCIEDGQVRETLTLTPPLFDIPVC